MIDKSLAMKPVLISGGGLASLLLARRLLRSRIPFLVFERDDSLSFRAQGYRLRLSSEGLDAIEEALGPEGFPKFWDRCGKTGGAGFAALDAITGDRIDRPEPPQPKKSEEAGQIKDDVKPWAPTKESLNSRDGKTIGISRGDMRALFLEGCEPFVRFSHRVVGYEETPNGVHAVFADGSKSVEGEMLVGGEGIYSKVAKQVSGGKLKTYDMGARGIHDLYANMRPDGQAPTTAFNELGEGVWRAVDETNPSGKIFIITNVRNLRPVLIVPNEPVDDPEIYFGWTMIAQPGIIKPPNDDLSIIGKPAADMAKALTANWTRILRPLFTEMDEANAAFWKITCSTPSGVPHWPNNPRVTAIGDAVHSMTPAGGIGANTAVRDSALLGRLLAEAGGRIDGITKEYEEKMRVYATEAVKSSYGMATAQFGVLIDETTPTVGA